MEAPGPADVESNIFYQFDVEQKGCSPIIDQYYCLLSPCFEEQITMKTRWALKMHRDTIHCISDEGNNKLPNGWEIRDWVLIGKPRPCDVPVKAKLPPKKSGKKSSLSEQGSDMAASAPDVESNIFQQFDVEQKGVPAPGCAPVIKQYYCLLSPCFEKKITLKSRHSLQNHRETIHCISDEGNNKLPNGWDIKDWVLIGKPRPYEVPVVKPKLPGNKSKNKSSLRARLLHCKQGMAELQPASLDSNIYEQFDVRQEEESSRPLYICLLPPCFEKEECFETHVHWERHRSREHNEPDEENNNLPTAWEIRDWVAKNKPRPFDVPVKHRKPNFKFSRIDPDVFTEFDIRETDEGKERFFCLLDTCSEKGKSFSSRRNWKTHRELRHKLTDYENGVYTIPKGKILRDWVEQGKPFPYQIPPLLQAPSRAGPSTETRNKLKIGLKRRQWEVAKSNVFFQFDISNDVDGKPQFFCLLPGCMESGTSLSGRRTLITHRSKVHNLLPLEHLPRFHIMEHWRKLGKPRPYTPPVEDPSKRDRRRTWDRAAGCSSEAEPAHQKKLRHSGWSVAASGEDSTGSFWKSFLNEMNSAHNLTNSPDDQKNSSDDETASSVSSSRVSSYDDPDCDDHAEDVDDRTVDQTLENPDHHYSAEMAEVGEEAPEDSVAPENSVPSMHSEEAWGLEYKPWNWNCETSQCPPQDFHAAEMAEVGDEAPEEFVAPENLLTCLPSFQSENPEVSLDTEVSSEDSNEIQAEPDQESVPVIDKGRAFIYEPEPAGTAEVGDEAPEGSVAPENLVPFLPVIYPEEMDLLLSLLDTEVSSEDFNEIQAKLVQESVTLEDIVRSCNNDLSVLPQAEETPECLFNILGRSLEQAEHRYIL